MPRWAAQALQPPNAILLTACAAGPVQLPFGIMAIAFAAIYLACYFFFGFVWWLLVRCAGAASRFRPQAALPQC